VCNPSLISSYMRTLSFRKIQILDWGAWQCVGNTIGLICEVSLLIMNHLGMLFSPHGSAKKSQILVYDTVLMTRHQSLLWQLLRNPAFHNNLWTECNDLINCCRLRNIDFVPQVWKSLAQSVWRQCHGIETRNEALVIHHHHHITSHHITWPWVCTRGDLLTYVIMMWGQRGESHDPHI
jgi:hypothetical protein